MLIINSDLVWILWLRAFSLKQISLDIESAPGYLQVIYADTGFSLANPPIEAVVSYKLDKGINLISFFEFVQIQLLPELRREN